MKIAVGNDTAASPRTEADGPYRCPLMGSREVTCPTPDSPPSNDEENQPRARTTSSYYQEREGGMW